MATTPDDDVPKLPRGRGLRLSRPAMVRIGGTVLLLVFLLTMQRPCASSVSRFVTSFGSGGSGGPGGPAAPGSGAPASAGSGGSEGSGGSAATGSQDDTYEHLRPGMTEDEVKAVIDRARIKAAGSGGKP